MTLASEAMYNASVRAKYTAEDKKTMLKNGQAMKNANGDASYPIADEEDLDKAIHAVGRGGSDHDSIRKHIIARAKALGLSSKIPDNWNSDGSMKAESNSARADSPTKDCPTCKGKGTIMEGNRKCPTCKGDGTLPDKAAEKQSNAKAWNDAYERLVSDHARQAWDASKREMTFDDTKQCVKQAICDALLDAWVFNPDQDYLYVQDLTTDWVVFSINYDGQLWQVDYTMDDSGACTVDMASRKEVARVTSYAPAPAGAKNDGMDRSTTDDSQRREKVPAEVIDAPVVDPEHRELVPVSMKKPKFANPYEWAWPAAGSFRIQERKGDDDKSLTVDFTGYAAMTGGDGYAVSDWLGTYTERMAPGCFAVTLRDATAVPLLFNHTGLPLASYPGTSELCEDAKGLKNEAVLDLRSGLSNDVALSMSRGDLTKMSFSFAAVKQSWSTDYESREVTESRLYDTSVVTFPMNPATSAMLRSAMQEGLGREGMGIFGRMLGRGVIRETRGFHFSGDGSIFDLAFRALQAADETAVKRHGMYGRARTFIVGDVLEQARAGATISAANAALLKQTMDSLHTADDQLNSVNKALDNGMSTLSQLLQVANPDDDADDPDNPGNADGSKPAGANNSGVSGDQGGTGGNTNTPNDGAGSRDAQMDVARLKARGLRYAPTM